MRRLWYALGYQSLRIGRNLRVKSPRWPTRAWLRGERDQRDQWNRRGGARAGAERASTGARAGAERGGGRSPGKPRLGSAVGKAGAAGGQPRGAVGVARKP
jgi:hypothetical protein